MTDSDPRWPRKVFRVAREGRSRQAKVSRWPSGWAEKWHVCCVSTCQGPCRPQMPIWDILGTRGFSMRPFP